MDTILKKEQIVIPPREDFEREDEPEFCEHLAETIRVEGFVHRPIVRPIEEGKYELVTGRKRLAAWFGILGNEEVECDVREYSDEEARAVRLAENIWRLPLKDSQMAAALIEWRKVHLSVRKETDQKGTSGGRPRGFTSTIKSALGVSHPTASNLNQIAKNLKPEDVPRLESLKANKEEYVAVARLKDPEVIEDAISTAEREQVPIDEAIRRAKRNAEVKSVAKAASQKTSSSPEPKGSSVLKAPEPIAKRELTDDEWLEEECGNILKNLKRTGPFRRDAILYRRFHKKAAAFREFIKPFLKAAKHPDGNGACYGVFYKLAYMAHPGSWWVCGQCKGTGLGHGLEEVPGPTPKCDSCGGSGYRLKTEVF